jgi:hypothetical protein
MLRFLFDQRRFSEAQALAGSALNVIPDNNASANPCSVRINFEQRQYSEAACLLKTAAGKGEFREVWGLLALSYLRAQQLTWLSRSWRKLFEPSARTRTTAF